MKPEKTRKLYPKFDKYAKKVRGYATTNTSLEGIMLWYEFLEKEK